MAPRTKLGTSREFDLVVVRNTGKKMVTLRHRQVGDVDVAPGKQRTIPIAVALVNLGNPSAADSGRSKDRSNEFKKVRRKWGFCAGFHSEDAWFSNKGINSLDPVNPDGSPKYVGPFCPPIEVYDLEGERIYFVHDDPDGTVGSGEAARAAVEAASDDRFRDRAFDEMRAEIARLRDIVDNRETPAVATEAGPNDQPHADSAPVPPDAGNADPSASGDSANSQSQADRNETRDSIPTPPAEEKPITADKPASTRVGRGK